jgi:hypothetical protein
MDITGTLHGLNTRPVKPSTYLRAFSTAAFNLSGSRGTMEKLFWSSSWPNSVPVNPIPAWTIK